MGDHRGRIVALAEEHRALREAERTDVRLQGGGEAKPGFASIRLAADHEEPCRRRLGGDTRGRVEEEVLALERRERADDAEPHLAVALHEIVGQGRPAIRKMHDVPHDVDRRGARHDRPQLAGHVARDRDDAVAAPAGQSEH
jgi:hypothetical protein